MAQKVGLLDYDGGRASALGVFGGQRVGGLWSQGGVVGQGLAAEGGDDAVMMPRTPTVGSGR
jgi:hypothetical protein